MLRLNDTELAYTPLKADQAHMTSLLLANLTAPQREYLARLNDWDAAVYRAAHDRFEADMAQHWTQRHERSLIRLRDRRDALSWTCRSNSMVCIQHHTHIPIYIHTYMRTLIRARAHKPDVL